MKKLLLSLLICLSSLPLGASEMGFSRKLQERFKNTGKSTNPSQVPGYKTDSPPETAYFEHNALGKANSTVFTTHKLANDVRKIAEDRPYFRIDPETDPIMKNATEVVQNPEKVIEGGAYNRTPQTTYTLKKCKEAKPDGEFKCSKSLLISSIHIQPEQVPHWYCYKGNHPHDYSRCGARTYTTAWRTYQPEVITPLKEEWTSTCQNMEARQKKGLCKLLRRVCTDGPSERVIAGTMGAEKSPGFRKIKRDCWRYEEIYSCSHASENTCETLRKSSCEQYGSKCISKVGDTCIEWEQTFRCPDKIMETRAEKVGKPGFKLPKAGTDVKPQDNTDFQDAMTKLSVFNSIQKDMRANGDGKTINVFKGKPRKCTVAWAGFKNCCTNGKGWGVSLKLSDCEPEEKELAEYQSKKLCVQVGDEYCADREPLTQICLRKKKAYCCFPSRLSRILHEQGRPQIGKGFGEAEHPSCEGFTPQELSRLNFDKMNLSELYEEVASRAKQKTVKIVQRNLSERVSQMTHSFKNQSKTGDF